MLVTGKNLLRAAGKKSFTVKWKKTKQTSGYLIKYSTSPYMKKPEKLRH